MFSLFVCENDNQPLLLYMCMRVNIQAHTHMHIFSVIVHPHFLGQPNLLKPVHILDMAHNVTDCSSYHEFWSWTA